jgi:3-deoxy-D-manno-octulosonic-acid transferase
MATSQSPHPEDTRMASDVLDQLKQLIQRDPTLADELRHIETTEQAAELIRQHGLQVTAAALWRHRGTLVQGGRPTWRG